ncbi:GGDEF domain-containing protein [Pseudodesulfovibrio sp.]|uniref:GGDEF domain-containing protein n=1 Tax=unclassified Pseudodesulfovibrio TaxID=2661612 RepID=UPI003AFF9A47
MTTKRKNEAELGFRDLLKRFGIGDDPDWVAVVLFVRNLIRHLTVYTDDKKWEIQQEIFRELAHKDFSRERFSSIIIKLDAYLMQTVGAQELEEALASEKRSAMELLHEMDAVIYSMRGSSERQTRRLDDFRDQTVNVIKSSNDRSVIVSRVRDMFQELILEFKEEAREWSDKARMLERSASFDPLLTGLHNRRALDAFLEQAVAEQADDPQPLSIIMIDVDHFKRVNDTCGHQVGDDVLRVLAGIITTNAIQYRGFSARYGGEELVVVLKGIPQSGAFFCAESIRSETERYYFRPRKDGQPVGDRIPFTVSAGVAQWQPGWDAAQLVSAADAAMYRAKNSGRNSVAAHGVDET